jgi:hypothetical protein
MDINIVRASAKPVGDPNDWENNDDFMHPDNFKIRLFSALDDASELLKTGDRSKFISSDEFLSQMKELRNEANETEAHDNGY